MILVSLPGEASVFHSSDTNEGDPDIVHFPLEYLQCLLDVGGLPPSRLVLKVGCPVILLRNLYPSEGLCNVVE